MCLKNNFRYVITLILDVWGLAVLLFELSEYEIESFVFSFKRSL